MLSNLLYGVRWLAAAFIARACYRVDHEGTVGAASGRGVQHDVVIVSL